MDPDELAVLLLEPDPRLSDLVTRYLAGHSIRVVTISDAAMLASELALRRYACVMIPSTFAADEAMRVACKRAGVPSVYVRMSAREMLEHVRTLAGRTGGE